MTLAHPCCSCSYIPSNGFTGALPEELGQLTSLNMLSLQNNGFTNLPQSIGNLTSASYVDVSFNKLQGSIPSSIGQLDQLNVLWLMNNDLSGPVPASLTALVPDMRSGEGSQGLQLQCNKGLKYNAALKTACQQNPMACVLSC